MLKRLIDILLSSIALFILFPLFAVVAILIKLDSKGPVFYRGIRIGRHEKSFRIYKFRTMVANAEKLGGPSTAADDPRLTKIGKNFVKRFIPN
jgi:lipopolysaccharide/colanic/teichoic acid biosynthesis glycosyltransferase